jgi:hypothetical protein
MEWPVWHNVVYRVITAETLPIESGKESILDTCWYPLRYIERGMVKELLTVTQRHRTRSFL